MIGSRWQTDCSSAPAVGELDERLWSARSLRMWGNTFEEAMRLMRKHGAQAREDGFHILLPVAHEHVAELIREFDDEHDDNGLRCWLLELIGEARSPRAFSVLAGQL